MLTYNGARLAKTPQKRRIPGWYVFMPKIGPGTFSVTTVYIE